MSLTPQQKKEAREHVASLRKMQAFAKSIMMSGAATPYEKEMAGSLYRYAYRTETDAALLGGDE